MSEILSRMGRNTPGAEHHAWRQRPLLVSLDFEPSLGPIDKLSLGGAIDLVVEPGPPALIVAGADELTIRSVLHRAFAGTLRLQLPDRPVPVPGLIPSPFPRRVVIGVRLPEVPNVVHEGEGDVYLYGLNQTELFLSHSGQGRAWCFGRAGGLATVLSGQGAIDASRLECRHAFALLSGRGDIELTAREGVTAKLSGDGCIRIGGNPVQVSRELSGTGRIECH